MQETIWFDLKYISNQCYRAGVVIMLAGALAGGFGGYWIGKLVA